jgi:dihydroorotate dehydrogenase electron transfer subunit
LNRLTEAEIISNKPLTEEVYLLCLKTPNNIKSKPGQFFILRTNKRLDPLLGRPFSAFDIEENTIKFLYRVKGKGTLILSKLKKGDRINLSGPFGRWYPYPENDFIVIAGGIGIASVFYLIKNFPDKAILFYGAREKKEIFFPEKLKLLTKKLYIATECGSLNYKGLITDLFKEKGLKLQLPIYACGPMPMIKELKKIIQNTSIPCYVAVEERMACGVGACLGCVIETKEGLKRVCTEGPVFEIGELKL